MMTLFQRVYVAFLELNPRKYLAGFRRELEELASSWYRTIIVLYTVVIGLFEINLKEIDMKNQIMDNTSASGAEKIEGTLKVSGNKTNRLNGVCHMNNNPIVHTLCTPYSSIVAIVTGLLGNIKTSHNKISIALFLAVVLVNPVQAAIFKAPTGMTKAALALAALFAFAFVIMVAYDVVSLGADQISKPRSASRTEGAEREMNLVQNVITSIKDRFFALLITVGFLIVAFGIEVIDTINSGIFA